MRTSPIIADSSPGHTPQYLENSCPGIILGLDNLWGWGVGLPRFQGDSRGSGDRPAQPLLAQTEAKALLSPLRGSVFSSAEWAAVHQSRAMRVRGESCVKGLSPLSMKSRSCPLELCHRAESLPESKNSQ